jgi:hypothetical protein
MQKRVRRLVGKAELAGALTWLVMMGVGWIIAVKLGLL